MASSAFALLHLCDSLFPIGGFGYSDGLESAVASGMVASRADLVVWLDAALDEGIRRTDGPAVVRAWKAWLVPDWAVLTDIDREVVAIRPAAATRQSCRSMGRRLAKTWCAIHPDPRLSDGLGRAAAGEMGLSLPVAFAGACAASGVEQRATVEAFAYTRLASTVSAAMRLMAIGQTDAHACLAGVLARAPSVLDDLFASDLQIESFAPSLDAAAMTHPYVASRLFRS